VLHPWIIAVAVATAAAPETLVVPIQGIVVTGTRAPEPALRVPAAISVIPRERFENTRGISLEDALGSTPGVFVQSRGGAQDVRVTIRGFGARGNGERSNAGNMRGIRVLTDGIPLTEPDGRTSLDLVDLGSVDRIEVSRSNVSALYGNASGGVLNLRTNLDFAAPWLELRSRAGAYGYHREQERVGFAAGEARGTFSFSNSSFDGWRAHSASSATQAQMRLSAPLGSGTRLGVLLDAASDLNRFPGALTQAQLDANPKQANPNFVTRDDRRVNKVGRVAMTLDRSVEASQDLALTLFVEPKVLQRSERGRFRDFNRYHVGGSAVYQLRSRLSGDVTSRTSLGGDEAYQDGSIMFYDLTPSGGRGTGLAADKREGANSAGGFIEQELTWKERWSVRAAARYDNLWYIANDHMDPTLDGSKHFTRLTPKGSVSYRAGDHTIYAALGGGVESPAFNEIDPPPSVPATSLNPFLEPMHSTTYELGAKGELAGSGALGRLRYDLAGYYIDVANDIVPWNGGSYFFTAGSSHRSGAEAALDWQPTDRVLIAGTANLMSTRYDKYVNDLGDFTGKQIAGLPRAIVTALARVTTPWGVGVQAGLQSVGGVFVDDANSVKSPDYVVANASLDVARRIGPTTLRVFVAGDNLADRSYVGSVFINGINGEYFEPGLPRNWSAGLNARW
jgi:iron complex outermembrane receptor protein